MNELFYAPIWHGFLLITLKRNKSNFVLRKRLRKTFYTWWYSNICRSENHVRNRSIRYAISRNRGIEIIILGNWISLFLLNVQNICGCIQQGNQLSTVALFSFCSNRFHNLWGNSWSKDPWLRWLRTSCCLYRSYKSSEDRFWDLSFLNPWIFVKRMKCILRMMVLLRTLEMLWLMAYIAVSPKRNEIRRCAIFSVWNKEVSDGKISIQVIWYLPKIGPFCSRIES